MIQVVLSPLPTTFATATAAPEDTPSHQEGHSKHKAQGSHSNDSLKQVYNL